MCQVWPACVLSSGQLVLASVRLVVFDCFAVKNKKLNALEVVKRVASLNQVTRIEFAKSLK